MAKFSSVHVRSSITDMSHIKKPADKRGDETFEHFSNNFSLSFPYTSIRLGTTYFDIKTRNIGTQECGKGSKVLYSYCAHTVYAGQLRDGHVGIFQPFVFGFLVFIFFWFAIYFE